MNRFNPLLDVISDENFQDFVLQLLREIRRWVTDHREQAFVRDAMEKYDSPELVKCHIENRASENGQLPLDTGSFRIPKSVNARGVGGTHAPAAE